MYLTHMHAQSGSLNTTSVSPVLFSLQVLPDKASLFKSLGPLSLPRLLHKHQPTIIHKLPLKKQT